MRISSQVSPWCCLALVNFYHSVIPVSTIQSIVMKPIKIANLCSGAWRRHTWHRPWPWFCICGVPWTHVEVIDSSPLSMYQYRYHIIVHKSTPKQQQQGISSIKTTMFDIVVIDCCLLLLPLILWILDSYCMETPDYLTAAPKFHNLRPPLCRPWQIKLKVAKMSDI